MAKKDRPIDVSAPDVDYRGKLRNADEDDDFARNGAKKGKKKKDTRKEKLKALAEEEEPKKKKKRRKIDDPATSKQLAKMERRKEKLEAAIVLMPAEGNDEFDRQYRSMFDNLQSIITAFEDRMQEAPSSRDVYALSTLYSQMREVIADIRSSKDVTQQIVELETQAYSSFMKSIGQSYVDLYFKLQKDIRSFVKDEEVQFQLLETLQGVCKDQADIVQGSYQSMLERVRTVLS